MCGSFLIYTLQFECFKNILPTCQFAQPAAHIVVCVLLFYFVTNVFDNKNLIIKKKQKKKYNVIYFESEYMDNILFIDLKKCDNIFMSRAK